jgi:hypothetical protein
MNKELVNKMVQALVHCLVSIVSFIFLTPLKLWLKAAERLTAQKEAGLLDMAKVQGEWPLLSYLKRFTLDFWFDAIAFLAFPVGILFAFYNGFDAWGTAADVNEANAEAIKEGWIAKESVLGAFAESWIATIVASYFCPVFCFIFHDLFVIVLLPIRKLIDWFKKPAQHMDLDIKNK